MTKRASLPYHLGFNAQHSPMGAFMSFTCGNFGTRGGIGLQIGQPGDQEVFIGFKDGDRYSDATLKCLPFYTAAVEPLRRCLSGGAGRSLGAERQAGCRAVQGQRILRSYGWASDQWAAEGLSFYGLFSFWSDSRSRSGKRRADARGFAAGGDCPP